MNRHPLSRTMLAALLASSSLAVLQAEDIWPMPSPFPNAPQGAVPAAYPLPRLDWPQRVANTNDRAQKLANSIKLIFDGDSITDGWQGKGKQVWTERYDRFGAFDFGISGDRTQHLLWRLHSGQVDNIHPKLIALMIGTNNLGNKESAADTIAGVKAVVAEYQKRCPDAVILLQAIFPRGQKADDPMRVRIKEVNAEIAKLGNGRNVIFTDFGDKFLEPDGSMSAEIMPDFLHPGEKGYQVWADAIQPIIDQHFPR